MYNENQKSYSLQQKKKKKEQKRVGKEVTYWR